MVVRIMARVVHVLFAAGACGDDVMFEAACRSVFFLWMVPARALVTFRFVGQFLVEPWPAEFALGGLSEFQFVLVSSGDAERATGVVVVAAIKVTSRCVWEGV